tara:strand:- start:362 stop:466 length:105 start_codon:yes stop_codon:yes gene_type:complete
VLKVVLVEQVVLVKQAEQAEQVVLAELELVVLVV